MLYVIYYTLHAHFFNPNVNILAQVEPNTVLVIRVLSERFLKNAPFSLFI
jgi:hypothetical protein